MKPSHKTTVSQNIRCDKSASTAGAKHCFVAEQKSFPGLSDPGEAETVHERGDDWLENQEVNREKKTEQSGHQRGTDPGIHEVERAADEQVRH